MQHVAHDPPAIVLSGGPIAISVARSLGGAGVRVYALGDAPRDTVAHSRYCHSFVDLGSGEGVQERWLAWLESGPRDGVLIPCHDDALDFIGRNRPSLVELGYLPYEANDEVVLAMLDKEKTYELARRIGVPAPRTVVLRDHGDFAEAVAEIGIPCAIKPLHAHLFVRHFGWRQKAFVVHELSDVEQEVRGLLDLGLEVMVTEVIPGSDDQLFSFISYLDDEGKPLFQFVKRKLRQFPPGFGMGCYHVEEWNDEVAELGMRFFQGIGLRGFAYVEFKRDPRDKSFKLIECNHRFGTGIELLLAAGIDAPLLMYQRALGRPVAPVDSYQRGVRLWHPLDDIRAFMIYRQNGVLSVREWGQSLMHRLRFPVLRWDDPKPSLMYAWLLTGQIRSALRRMIARHSSDTAARTIQR
jgi:D-aspartate ligase